MKEIDESYCYKGYIKNVHFYLPGFKYLHTLDSSKSIYVGRHSVQTQLLGFLSKGGSKGSYLITGYRGMGKTTLVSSVLERYIEHKNEINISTHIVKVSFGQRDLKEIDILKQILFQIANIYSKKIIVKNYSKFSSTSCLFVAGFAIVIALFYCLFKLDKFSPDNDWLKSEYVISYILIGIAGALLTNSILKFIFSRSKLLSSWKKVNELYDRCSSSVTKEAGTGSGNQEFPFSYTNKETKTYPQANPKEISRSLIDIINDDEGQNRHYVFVFDELDKIDIAATPLSFYEDLNNNDKGETIISYNEHRKRIRLVLDILSSLKYLISEANAKFIFIAGSEMFDASLADVADRSSALSSIFSHVVNLDSLLKDKSESSLVGVGVTNLVEHFLKVLLLPEFLHRYIKDYSLISIIAKCNFPFEEDKFKAIYTIQEIIIYLTYRSNGSPKKMIRLIEEQITCKNYNEYIMDGGIERKNIIVYKIDGSKYPEHSRHYINLHNASSYVDKSMYCLSFKYHDQYKIGLLNYIYRPVIISKSRTMKNYSDALLVATPYLMNHIIKFHPFAFSLENLELLPEVLSSNRRPELRYFLEEIIEYFKTNFVRETETKLFDYKFNFKIANEISYVSKIFVEESASFNFTLDENYNVKVHVRLKIKELRSVYQHFGGADAGNALDSLALYNILLGDLHYFDQEYSDAIGCYMDALTALQNQESDRKIDLSANTLHILSYIKCQKKLGLTYEKIKSYEKAISCYIDVIKIISSQKSIYADIFLSIQLQRSLINAVLSCLFVYEKKPSLGNIKHLFSKILSSKIEIKNSDISFFESNLKREDYFISSLALLTFYKGILNETDEKLILNAFDLNDIRGIKSESITIILTLKSIQLNLHSDTKTDINNWFTIVNECYSVFHDATQSDPKFKMAIDYRNNITSIYNIARQLSRLGNLALIELKEKEVNSESLKELAKKITDTCRNRNINMNDDTLLLRTWLQSLHSNCASTSKGETPLMFSITSIIYMYLLSASLYFKVGQNLMAGHQYRKILGLFRSLSQSFRDCRDNKSDKAMIDNFLFFIERTLVKRSIQIASWNSSSTDRNQIYKYKHAMGIDTIFHPLEYSMHNYMNLSNSSEVKEALWHYAALKAIVTGSCEHEQNLVNQSGTIHTMFSRMNELSLQCVFNKSNLEKTLRECEDDKALNLKDYEKDFYKFLKGSEDRTLESLRVVKIKEGLEQDDKFSAFEGQLTYLSDSSGIANKISYIVSNWIYCIHNIINIMQMMGTSYLVNNTTQADMHRRFGRVLKYYELCKWLSSISINSVKNDKENKIVNIDDLLSGLIGKDTIKSYDATSQFQLANSFYLKAINAHTSGSQYRHLITNMYFLEDDFHDNILHYSIAFERRLILSGKIYDYIENLKSEIRDSQVFMYENYAGNDTTYRENGIKPPPTPESPPPTA